MRNVFIDINGIVHEWFTPDIHAPLDTLGVMATLNAVLGLWTLEDAARSVNLTEKDLINEAQSWAVAQQLEEKNNAN